jgi:RNA polymerase sigma-70 factor (ECF subfamily)
LDEKKIFSINSGDRKVFKQVFDLFYNALCAFSIKYIQDWDAVEDIVQEVFVTFYEHKKEFENIQSIKAYLYTAARNKCLNFLKHRTVIQRHEQALIYELESSQFFTSHVIEEETFNLLYAEIRQLPEGSQAIMLLAVKGLKNKEIAEKLQISENTVKTQKKIAYTKIKENLKTVFRSIFLSFL